MAPVQPHFPRVPGELQERVPVEMGSQLETAFATISETLISGSLSQIPRDRAVLPLIREYAGKRAADEGRHQQYFASGNFLVNGGRSCPGGQQARAARVGWVVRGSVWVVKLVKVPCKGLRCHAP